MTPARPRLVILLRLSTNHRRAPLQPPLPPPPPALPRCLRDRTRLVEGTHTADAAAAATSSPRTRGAPRPISRRAWSTTHSPRMTTRTTTRSPSAKGGTGLRRHRPSSPPGTGSLLLEELEPSGPAHRDHKEGSPLQPKLPPSPALPPMFQGALTEAHWQMISADV